MLQRATTSASESANEASRAAFERKFPGVISASPRGRDARFGAGAFPLAAAPAFVSTRGAPVVEMRIGVSPPARAAPVATVRPADAVRVLTSRELGVLAAFADGIKKNARG